MNEEHVYLGLMRPPGPGAVPRDGLIWAGDEEGVSKLSGRSYWGRVAYSRMLEAEEVEDYELEYLGMKHPATGTDVE